MKRNITICSHFHSCNYGDKYQSITLVEKLKCIPNLKLIKANLILIKDSKLRQISYDNNLYDIQYLLDNNIYSDVFYLTTGSIGCGSSYHGLLVKLLNRKLIGKLVIIGGFSGDIIIEQLDKLKYLFEENVYFYSRTINELELYKKLGNHITNNKILSKFYYKGELIANNIIQELKMIKLYNNHCKQKIGILSVYLFKYNNKQFKSILQNLLNNLDKIILIDTYCANLSKKYLEEYNYNGKIVVSNDTRILMNELIDAKVVISSRLHGGLISILMNIPTYFLPTDNCCNDIPFIPINKENLGSFKYQSLAKLYNNENGFIAKMTYLEQVNNLLKQEIYYPVNKQLIKKYIFTCEELLQEFVSYAI